MMPVMPVMPDSTASRGGPLLRQRPHQLRSGPFRRRRGAGGAGHGGGPAPKAADAALSGGASRAPEKGLLMVY
jgi:hypothetical protein